MASPTSSLIPLALASDNNAPTAMQGQLGPPRAEWLGRVVDVAANPEEDDLSLQESRDSDSRDRYFDLAERIMGEPLGSSFSADVHSEYNRNLDGGRLPYSNIHPLATTPYNVNGGFGPEDEDIFGTPSSTDEPSAGQTPSKNIQPAPKFLDNLRQKILPVDAPAGLQSNTPRGCYARSGQRQYTIPDGLNSHQILDSHIADVVGDVLLEFLKHGWTVDAIHTWVNRSVNAHEQHEVITHANLRKRLSLARKQKEEGETGAVAVPLIHWIPEELEYANGQ